MAKRERRPTFYDYATTSESMESAITERIKRKLETKRYTMLDSRNMYGYSHGNRWSLNPEGDSSSRLQSFGTEYELPIADIIDHDTELLPRHEAHILEQLSSQFMKHFYETVGRGAQSVGNTVSAKQHGDDFAQVFVAMLEKVSFGVDRYGRPMLPEIHVHPSTGTKILQTLSSQPAEYHIRVEELKAAKEKQATRDETDRLARYRWKTS